MAVPPQQQLHRPILEIVSQAADEVVSIQRIRTTLIRRFSLNEEDLSEVVPSGQNRFANRVYWAVSYLKRAGLLEAPSRAHFRITDQGQRILSTYSGDLGITWLKGLTVEPTVGGEVNDPIVEQVVTPDEQFEALYTEFNERLADELMESVRRIQPDRFEYLVVRLLEKMGYGEGKVVGRSGDGGIDGIINQDQLGLEKVYIQAKRWQNQVGAPEIYSFAGSLSAQGASKGVFITTSYFGQNARQIASKISAGNQLIRLIDGEELAQLMIRYDVGVFTETTYHIKKLDENYLSEEL